MPLLPRSGDIAVNHEKMFKARIGVARVILGQLASAGVEGDVLYTNVSRTQANGIVELLRSMLPSLSASTKATLQHLVLQVPWKGDEGASLANMFANGLGGMSMSAHVIARMPMQDWRAMPNYYMAVDWDMMKPASCNVLVKAQVVIKGAVVLGLRWPTESTVKLLTAMLLTLCGWGCEANPGKKDLRHWFKTMFKAAARRAGRPFAYVRDLPQSPEEFKRLHSEMYAAAYGVQNPCPPKISWSSIIAQDASFRCRSSLPGVFCAGGGGVAGAGFRFQDLRQPALQYSTGLPALGDMPAHGGGRGNALALQALADMAHGSQGSQLQGSPFESSQAQGSQGSQLQRDSDSARAGGSEAMESEVDESDDGGRVIVPQTPSVVAPATPVTWASGGRAPVTPATCPSGGRAPATPAFEASGVHAPATPAFPEARGGRAPATPAFEASGSRAPATPAFDASGGRRQLGGADEVSRFLDIMAERRQEKADDEKKKKDELKEDEKKKKAELKEEEKKKKAELKAAEKAAAAPKGEAAAAPKARGRPRGRPPTVKANEEVQAAVEVAEAAPKAKAKAKAAPKAKAKAKAAPKAKAKAKAAPPEEKAMAAPQPTPRAKASAAVIAAPKAEAKAAAKPAPKKRKAAVAVRDYENMQRNPMFHKRKPHWNHERSRMHVLTRTGFLGKGQSTTFKYGPGTDLTLEQALEKAQRFVTEETERQQQANVL
jgi:hypothetical protein